MNDEAAKDSTTNSSYWRFVEKTAKEAEAMPAWMKGGTSGREQRRPKPLRAHMSTSGSRKK